MTMSFACRVKRAIADELGVDSDALTSDMTFAKLGVSDLQFIHIGMSMEDIVDAEASDDDLERCKSIGDLLALADRLAEGAEIVA